MVIGLEVFNYFLIITLIGVTLAWAVLIKSMLESFRKTPFLDKFKKETHGFPKVSIILPARNEERFISKCLDSLLKQNYENYEIIAINDSSTDATGDIIEKYAKINSKVIAVNAEKKPEEWMGKNWACIQGYQKATGELLLFTDSDTYHADSVISLSVSHLLSLKLDALTVIPRMLCLDNLTRITLPMISTFLHTRFSALKVNDPKKKTGYFFGSFFIIRRSIYDAVGTHEGVKHEIIEDGALGSKVKESKFKMSMVRGEHLINAVWARDRNTLWNALKRLMVPLYLQGAKTAIGIFVAILFLLFIPFLATIYSLVMIGVSETFYPLFITSIISSCMIFAAAIIESTRGLNLGAKYALLCPIGSLIIVLGVASGIIQASSKNAVSLRGRSYSLKEHKQDAINV